MLLRFVPGENANNVTIDGAADCTYRATPQPWHLPERHHVDPGPLQLQLLLLHRLQGEPGDHQAPHPPSSPAR